MIETEIVIVGAGFSGLYMLHRLRGMGFSSCVIEAGVGVGGTWYWNRYPGARCDVESYSYSYSFSEDLQQDWSWSHRYSTQPEILRYANHVADRFDLRKDITLETRIASARFDEAQSRWIVTATDGRRWRCRFLIMATGCLSVPKIPDLPGLDSFRGDLLHTARWPDDGYSFASKRVGLVGTGSSAIQSIPIIAKDAAHLTVFQRSAAYSVPAWNRPNDAETERRMKSSYAALRAKARHSIAGDYLDEGHLTILDLAEDEREAAFEACWQAGGFNLQSAFADLLVSDEANRHAADFIRNKIRATVHDPATAEALCPKDHPVGAKRLCVDTDYYETFNRPNVALVDISADPLVSITPAGVTTRSGEHPFDTLVLATGFDAMTGALAAIDIRGRADRPLKDAWRDGPQTYLGISISGFPNLFTLTGPGSPSVFTNMMTAIEQHVEWLSDMLDQARAQGVTVIEAEAEAQTAWVARVNEGAAQTLIPKANSWYVGANVPGKPRVFMPFADGFNVYEAICNEIAADGYRGFRLTAGEDAAT